MAVQHLSNKETVALVCQYQRNKDPDMQKRILEAHEWFVAMLARKLTHDGEPTEDVLQEARKGLLSAIEKFDYSRAVQFTTFAYHYIRGSILDYYSKEEYSVSLDEPLDADNENSDTRKDRIPGSEMLDPARITEQRMMGAALRKAMDKLPMRLRRALIAYFFEDKSCREIGEMLGVSESWVTRLIRQGINKLRVLFDVRYEINDRTMLLWRGGSKHTPWNRSYTRKEKKMTDAYQLSTTEDEDKTLRKVPMTPRIKEAYLALKNAAVRGNYAPHLEMVLVVQNAYSVLRKAGLDPGLVLVLQKRDLISQRGKGEFIVSEVEIIDRPLVQNLKPTMPQKSKTQDKEKASSPVSDKQGVPQDTLEIVIFRHLKDATHEELLKFSERLTAMAILADEMAKNPLLHAYRELAKQV